MIVARANGQMGAFDPFRFNGFMNNIGTYMKLEDANFETIPFLPTAYPTKYPYYVPYSQYPGIQVHKNNIQNYHPGPGGMPGDVQHYFNKYAAPYMNMQGA